MVQQASKEQKKTLILLDSTQYALTQTLLPYSSSFNEYLRQRSLDPATPPAMLKKFSPQLRYLLQQLVDRSFPSLPASPTFTKATVAALQAGRCCLSISRVGTLPSHLLPPNASSASPKEITSHYRLLLLSIHKKLLTAIKEVRLPVGPVDVIVNQLGGEDAVAEITEREYRLVRRGAEGEGSSFEVQVRGQTDDEVLETNRKEWEAFVGGKKKVALLSAAASFQPDLPPSSDALLVLYSDVHASLPDTSLFSSTNSSTTLCVLHDAVLDSLLFDALACSLRQQGAVAQSSFLARTLGKETTLRSVMRVWRELLRSQTLPIACPDSVPSEDAFSDAYRHKDASARLELVVSELRRFGLDGEEDVTLETLACRLAGCCAGLQHVVKGILTDLMAYVDREDATRLRWDSGVARIDGGVCVVGSDE